MLEDWNDTLLTYPILRRVSNARIRESHFVTLERGELVPPRLQLIAGPDCQQKERNARYDINNIVIPEIHGCDNEQRGEDGNEPFRVKPVVEGEVRADKCQLRVSAGKDVSLDNVDRVETAQWDRFPGVYDSAEYWSQENAGKVKAKIRKVVQSESRPNSRKKKVSQV